MVEWATTAGRDISYRDIPSFAKCNAYCHRPYFDGYIYTVDDARHVRQKADKKANIR